MIVPNSIYGDAYSHVLVGAEVVIVEFVNYQ